MVAEVLMLIFIIANLKTYIRDLMRYMIMEYAINTMELFSVSQNI